MRSFQDGQDFTHLIRTAIPDFAESEYPLFVEFVSAYIRFLEQTRTFSANVITPEYGPAPTAKVVTAEMGGPLYEARKFLDYRDTITTLDEFKERFLAMYGKNFPQFSYVSTDWFVRSLRDFYQTKGTEQSVQWFFRTFFNEHAEIYYPRTDILKASDATWDAPVTLKVSTPIDGHTDADVAFYSGQQIQTATGTATVEFVRSYNVGLSFGQNIRVHELYLKYGSLGGVFHENQELYNIDTQPVIRTRVLPVITGLTIAGAGSNYAPGDLITISEGPGQGGGFGASARVLSTGNGSISGVVVNNGGAGYVVREPVLFTSATGHGASGYVSTLSNPEGAVFLDLILAPFCNSSATVTMSNADYGAATGVIQMNGMDIDTPLSDVLAAADEKPFYSPWVWTNSSNTTAALANLSIIVDDMAVQPFVNTAVATGQGYTGKLYLLQGPTDTVSNTANCYGNTTAYAEGYFAGGLAGNTIFGADVTRMYLVNVVHEPFIQPTLIIKQDYANTQNGTVSTTNACNAMVGVGTLFTTVLLPGAHIRVGNTSVGANVIVQSVANDTYCTIVGTFANTFTANSFASYPMGRIRTVTPRAQTTYGTISTVTLTSAGENYLVPPLVTVDSMDARVQELFYYQASNDSIITTDGRVSGLFQAANLAIFQGAGQIVRVQMNGTGVLYTDPGATVVNAVHSENRTGDAASLVPIIGAVTEYPGEFTTTQSFLSSDKHLQDGDFYNDYTYVVKVAESFNRYRDLLLRLIHPAGFKPYGQFSLIDELTIDASTPADIEIDVSGPSPSASGSPSASRSPSASASPSLSPSASISPSASVSPSISPSSSVSPSISPSASVSPSKSPSASISPSASLSPSASISPSLSCPADDFAGTGALSGNWTVFAQAGGGSITRSSGRAVDPTIFSSATAAYTGQSFANNQYSELRLVTLNTSSGASIGPMVRMSADAANGYQAVCVTDQAVSLSAVGAGGFIGSFSGSVVNGDVVRLVAVGNTFRLYINGILDATTITDSTFTSGYPGFWMGYSGEAQPVADDWVGCDFLGSASLSPSASVSPSKSPSASLSPSSSISPSSSKSPSASHSPSASLSPSASP